MRGHRAERSVRGSARGVLLVRLARLVPGVRRIRVLTQAPRRP